MVYIRALDLWRKKKMSGVNFLILAAVIVGVLAGLAGALLRMLTHTIESYLQNLQWDYKYYLFFIFPMIGILLTVLYVKYFIRKSKFEHGLSQLLYSISKKDSRLSFHNIYSQIFSSAITVGFGGSVGLESPIAVSGAAIGSNTGSFLGLNYRDRTMLLACGAGAGIASVFNSPVAGMVLAIELLLPEFSIPAFIPLLIATAVAAVVSQTIYHQPLFILVSEGWEMNALPLYALLGLFSGIFSIYFTRLTFRVGKLFSRIKNRYNKILTGGLLLGVMIAFLPVLYGEGYVTIQRLLDGDYHTMIDGSIFKGNAQSPLAIILFAFLSLFGKSLASLITLSSGGNGGNFGPSLVMGGLLGFCFAFSLHYFFGWELNITNFIVMGMAGAMSGIMHAPLTGIFLIAEITGGYKLMVPLMIVSAISYYISRRVSKHSIYTKALAEKGDLLSMEDRDRSVLHDITLLNMTDRDCLTLDPDDTLESRRHDIINSRRNIFPVVSSSKQLIGILYSEQLMEMLLSNREADYQKPFKELAQPPSETVAPDTDMYDVLQKMERKDLWVIPVLNEEKQFLGLVSKNTIFNAYRALLRNRLQFGSNENS